VAVVTGSGLSPHLWMCPPDLDQFQLAITPSFGKVAVS
jgi:hypothetical protein